MQKLKFIFLLIIPFFLTSCVDYVQSLAYKDGKYNLYYKVTLSKALFEMMDEDPESIFDEFDEDVMEEFPANVKAKPIDTDLEVGAEFSIQIDPKTTDKEEKSFLPTVAKNKCYIPFLLGSEDSPFNSSDGSSNSEGEAIVTAMLSSSKCRVMISKKIIPSIETAYFEGNGGQNYSIPLFDYGESYCLEIPFIIVLDNGMYRKDRIVVIRDVQ